MPDHIGSYQVTDLLGQGAMSRVYRARLPLLGDQEYAVKLLRERCKPREVSGFLGECAKVKRLGTHPHIVTLYFAGLDRRSGRYYVAMELVQGSNAAQMLAQTPGHQLPLKQVLEMGIQVASALEHAHQRGILHLDVKPSNILWHPEGNLTKLTDFGNARLREDATSFSAHPGPGTPAYQAWEQTPAGRQAGHLPTEQSDIYGLAATLYHLITGRLYFTTEEEQARPPSDWRPDLPPALSALLMRALSHDPQQRPASISEFRRTLEHLLTPPPLWHVPAPRNLFFTGREALLASLATTLHTVGTAAVTQAISGLGGVGKTQLALEYCYRCRDHYQSIFWVTAETYDTLLADLEAIADLLDLPERREAHQDRLVTAFKRWLEAHEEWLLVLDNVEDLALVRAVLPTTSRGQVMLTTRLQATRPLAEPLLLEVFSKEEGAKFLLARAGRLASQESLNQVPPEVRALAQTITSALGGLPLALDQAGAYLEETACSLGAYLDHFQTHRKLLLQRRGAQGWDHPASVLTTFTLTFTRLQEAHPASAEVLRCCAYLAPDAIPESLLAAGATALGSVLGLALTDPIAWDTALGALRQSSLIHRDAAARSLAIHRMVQAALQETMNPDEQRLWAERIVQAVNQAFPEVRFDTWERCQQYLPHVQACAELIERWHLTAPEAGHLLTRAGVYLTARAQYASAEALLTQGLHLREESLGQEHLHVAESLVCLAKLYGELGQPTKVEPLLQRVLALPEQTLEPAHPLIAQSYHLLGSVYEHQGQYTRAAPLYQQALATYHALGWDERLETAQVQASLGINYRFQGKYEQAEQLLQRALAIREKALPPGDPQVAVGLDNLAVLYNHQGKHGQAALLFQRALAIRERALGPQHPDVAANLYNLGILLSAQGRYQHAKDLLRRALEITSATFGAEHQFAAHCLKYLATVAYKQEHDEEAEQLLQQAMAIYEQRLGREHERIGYCLHQFGLLYARQGRYAQARACLEHALTIFADRLGPEQEFTAQSLSALAQVFSLQGEDQQAVVLYQQALAIYDHRLGKEHPGRADPLTGLAALALARGALEQAVSLYQEALSLQVQVLGTEHPDVIALRARYRAALQQQEAEASPQRRGRPRVKARRPTS